jgi:AraC-like DNA-binding protein
MDLLTTKAGPVAWSHAEALLRSTASPMELQNVVAAVATTARTGRELADCCRLIHRVAEATGEETLALSARPMIRGAAELVLSQASSAATLGEALGRIASSYNVLHGGDFNRLERRAGRVVFSIDDEAFPYTRPRDGFVYFTLEHALLFVHAAACELAGCNLTDRLRGITTRRPDDGGLGAAALGFWSEAVGYGARAYTLAYDAAVEDAPVVRMELGASLHRRVLNRMLRLLEQPGQERSKRPATRGMAREVRRALENGGADQSDVAHLLGVSVATLRRRLTLEGTTYRTLHQEVMNARARRRVLMKADLADVAEELGFSDRRAFSRAFKDWNGVTPSQYRLSR